jgi:hypothetical protein
MPKPLADWPLLDCGLQVVGSNEHEMMGTRAKDDGEKDVPSRILVARRPVWLVGNHLSVDYGAVQRKRP